MSFLKQTAYYNNALDFNGGVLLKMNRIFVCGGDIRSVYMAQHLKDKGFEVSLFGHGENDDDFSDITRADTVILGLPAFRDKAVNMPCVDRRILVDDLIAGCKSCSLLAGGRFTPEELQKITNAGIDCFDYSDDENFQIMNALYTAEGTIAYLISNTSLSVIDMKILITGYGRISKALCNLLTSWPCRVSVYARKDADRSMCLCRGFNVLESLAELSGFDVIINTVPADIFTEDALETIKTGGVIMDLSQRPGYVNKELCRKHGIKLMYLPGIPLTGAPQSAGIAAAKAVECYTEGN